MILIDITKYEIIIKRHVFEQAVLRGIHPDMIEQALLKGKIERFGKNGVKFVNRGSKKIIICVGEMTGNNIKIITIEVK